MARSKLNIVLAIILVFIMGAILGNLYSKPEVKNIVIYQKQPPKTLATEGAVVMRLPAVTGNDTGVFAQVAVTAKPGTGKILVNVNNVLTAPEVEQSARVAILVASNYTGIDTEKVDFLYELTADASLLEGPSAGAAFTVATIAALENKNISDKIMMTGTINHDGTIGPAGKIIEKAKAAKSAGATTFLVPVGMSSELNYTTSEFCNTWGTTEYCEPELKTEILDISKISGIKVVEVATVEDALRYALI